MKNFDVFQSTVDKDRLVWWEYHSSAKDRFEYLTICKTIENKKLIPMVIQITSHSRNTVYIGGMQTALDQCDEVSIKMIDAHFNNH